MKQLEVCSYCGTPPHLLRLFFTVAVLPAQEHPNSAPQGKAPTSFTGSLGYFFPLPFVLNGSLLAVAAATKPSYPGELIQPVQQCLFPSVSYDTRPTAPTIFRRKTQLSVLQSMCRGCWLQLSLHVSRLLNESLLFGTEAT